MPIPPLLVIRTITAAPPVSTLLVVLLARALLLLLFLLPGLLLSQLFEPLLSFAERLLRSRLLGVGCGV